MGQKPAFFVGRLGLVLPSKDLNATGWLSKYNESEMVMAAPGAWRKAGLFAKEDDEAKTWNC